MIVVPKTDDGMSVRQLLNSFSNVVPSFGVFVAELLLFIALFYTHLVWFSESRTNPDFSEHYLLGIFQAFWFAVLFTFPASEMNFLPPPQRSPPSQQLDVSNSPRFVSVFKVTYFTLIRRRQGSKEISWQIVDDGVDGHWAGGLRSEGF